MLTNFYMYFNHNAVVVAIKDKTFAFNVRRGFDFEGRAANDGGGAYRALGAGIAEPGFQAAGQHIGGFAYDVVHFGLAEVFGRESQHGGGNLGGKRSAQMQVHRAVDMVAGKGHAAGNALIKVRCGGARRGRCLHGQHGFEHVHQVAVHKFTDAGNLYGMAHS